MTISETEVTASNSRDAKKSKEASNSRNASNNEDASSSIGTQARAGTPAKVGEDSNQRKTYNSWDGRSSREDCKFRNSSSIEAANGRDAYNKTKKANSIAGASTKQ
jgi:hypothetical protein